MQITTGKNPFSDFSGSNRKCDFDFFFAKNLILKTAFTFGTLNLSKTMTSTH